MHESSYVGGLRACIQNLTLRSRHATHPPTVDAVQGIKKGQAFGVALSTPKAKARFTMEHVGTASLTFGL